ncbi:10270_t:CDS:10 [Paraglomus brasilianum]|uniref:10270_t:CDS:1 n=1 Tax=Paraglomus brasilianum TaxID=144538 RepID=A0A9N9CH03_9GLOM|nr:10270_t:CDS:10 [Paraglomus brasilianum]
MDTEVGMYRPGITLIIHTVWKWSDEAIEKLKMNFRALEEDFHIEIVFISRKQYFELKGYDQENVIKARDEMIKLLVSKSAKEASLSFIIPEKTKRPSRIEDTPVTQLQPPQLHTDEEIPFFISTNNLERDLTWEEEDSPHDIFRFNDDIVDIEAVLGTKEFNMPIDYWMEISRALNVAGDLILDRRIIQMTEGKRRDIEEAMERLRVLEMIALRPEFKHLSVPLVHYPDASVWFKIAFVPLRRHEYFRDVVRHVRREPFILVPATRQGTDKFVIAQTLGKQPRSRSSKASSSRSSKSSVRPSPPPQSSAPPKPPLRPDDDYNAWVRLTDEQKSARKEAKKQQLASMRKMRARGMPEDEYGVVPRSSRRLPDDDSFEDDFPPRSTYETKIPADPLDERLADASRTPMRKTLRDIIYEKTIGGGSTSNINPGRTLREHNFHHMQDIFRKALKFCHPLKGEIRFFGSLGKTIFQKVPQHVENLYWEFLDLNMIENQLGVTHCFHNVAAYDDDHKLVEYLGEVCGEKPFQRTEHFEIHAKARNAKQADYETVVMCVNINRVQLEKVTFPWEHVADACWNVLDRVARRRSIRSSIKPFNVFMKKVSITPTKGRISFEDIPDFLHVTSISKRTTQKFKLHKPFIAEFSRIENIPIDDQHANKRLGKTGEGKVHYSLEITNFDHSQSFEENIHLCAGALPKWTIESILGPDPHLVKLVDFVKAMLLLVEKSDKVANKWFAQRGEVGVEEEDEEDFWNY